LNKNRNSDFLRIHQSLVVREKGLGSDIGHGLFVGWVEHPDVFCWVSFLNPTYVPAIFFAGGETQQNGQR
jgi:hypothetical protein